MQKWRTLPFLPRADASSAALGLWIWNPNCRRFESRQVLGPYSRTDAAACHSRDISQVARTFRRCLTGVPRS